MYSRSYSKNEKGIRTARPQQCATYSRTERFLNDDIDQAIREDMNEGSKSKSPMMLSKRSLETEAPGDRGIRTDRPCDSKSDVSKTESQLESGDQEEEKENVIPSSDNYPKLKGVTFATSSERSIRKVSNEKEFQLYFPILTQAYEILWVNRNKFFKTIMITYFILSTMAILKIFTSFIDTFLFMDFDNCQSAIQLCRRFGLACFGFCGGSRWDTFWYRAFGDRSML